MSTLTRITASRARVLLSQPFFGDIMMQVSPVESNKTSTMATDGRFLFFNAAWVDTLTPTELDGVLIHEAEHIALGHTHRMPKGSGPRAWSIACDHAVNLILKAARITVPPNGYCDARYTGMSAERILASMPPAPDAAEMPGGVVFNDAPREAERITNIVAGAATAAAMRGQLPVNIARMVHEASAPVADWRKALASWALASAREDTSWARPSRRSAASGVYAPARAGRAIGTLALAVDTSGSISPENLALFWSALTDVVHQCLPEKIVMVACDADATIVGEWDAREFPVVPPPLPGGGGTDFRPVFRLLEQHRPDGLLYFTDLEGTFPEIAPAYPVLWCALEDHAPPFGESLRIGDSA